MDTRAIARISLLAAMIAVLGLLPTFYLPVTGGVPITAQTLGVMLAGIVLGPRHGALAVLLLIFVVALGAPLLAGGRGGLGVFFAPSADSCWGGCRALSLPAPSCSASRTRRCFLPRSWPRLPVES
jgi:biotin transport system substrate-specific component